MFKVHRSAIKGYGLVMLATTLIFLIFFLVLPGFFPKFESTLFAIGGLLFSIPIGGFWHVFNRPILKIMPGKPETVDFHLFKKPKGPKIWKYAANRIIVKNVGRSSAKNCKGWAVMLGERREGKEMKVRVSWTVLPSEKPNATINVKDEERLDFCAYRKEGPEKHRETNISQPERVPKIIAPTEEGWPSPPTKARRFDDLTECEVWVTSENAGPAKAKVKFEEDEIKIEPL